jgi:hypothetical protein
VDVEFSKDADGLVADGRDAAPKLFGDFSARRTFTNLLKNAQLGRGELGQRRFGSVPKPLEFAFQPGSGRVAQRGS